MSFMGRQRPCKRIKFGKKLINPAIPLSISNKSLIKATDDHYNYARLLLIDFSKAFDHIGSPYSPPETQNKWCLFHHTEMVS